MATDTSKPENTTLRIEKDTTNEAKKIDFVIVFKINKDDDRKKINKFLQNLMNDKIEIYYINDVRLFIPNIQHMKELSIMIHVPENVLRKYLEIKRLRMPLHEVHYPETKPKNKKPKSKLVTWLCDEGLNEFVCFRGLNKWLKSRLDMRAKKTEIYWAEYAESRKYLFTDKGNNFPNDFISKSLRINIAYFILQRTEYGDGFYEKGIENLINENIISAAFPLHENDIDEKNGKRYDLYDDWARMVNMGRPQPIDKIKDYFGIKIALYFAWLGYYTNMLLFASILGIATTFYGWITISGHNHTKDICSSNFVMCPLCNDTCTFWHMNSTCSQAKLTHIFDNNISISFTVFMTVWSVLFLKLWKCYSAGLIHKWGLATYDTQEEHARPKYLMRLNSNHIFNDKEENFKNKSKENSEKNEDNARYEEPIVSFWKKRIPLTLVSFGTVLLLIFLVAGILFGFIIYRVSSIFVNKIIPDSVNQEIISDCFTAIINLILIVLFTEIYDRIAVYLTNIEYLRTQSEYDDSLALKIYLFNFVNYYSSILYIAFIKGKFVGYPENYNKILGFRLEECNQGGCYLEIFIQLSIIMIGKKTFTSIVKEIIPYIKKSYRNIKNNHINENQKNIIQKNSELLKYDHRYLFGEYMTMVIQYGFVILFVNAYPIAPLVALINNMIEMRLDAQKYVKTYQRPVSQRVINIGIWQNIMDILGRISIFSNAVMIAFSSKYIPYMVYSHIVNVNDDGSSNDTNFLNYTLSYFDVNDFEPYTKYSNLDNITTCRYRAYRYPPFVDNKYTHTFDYWTILFYRVLFIILFQAATNCLRISIDWFIPDVPSEIRTMVKKESILITRLIEKKLQSDTTEE